MKISISKDAASPESRETTYSATASRPIRKQTLLDTFLGAVVPICFLPIDFVFNFQKSGRFDWRFKPSTQLYAINSTLANSLPKP
ncbi:hypothetical protein NC652_027452 [Populus alba x Populus x berolinensis]|nr:hypothetical protein NC652_027452 [Populus alba x Populus x berolinensis]